MRILSLMILAYLFIGCGTTHHFLPGRPLQDGESAVNVVWHFDLNNHGLPDLFPDVTLYHGAGNNCNTGFGWKFPMYLSHVSVAKYWETGDDDYWAAWTHLNQVLGPNNNPMIEAGGSYIKHGHQSYQAFSAGLGYGSGVSWPWSLRMIETDRPLAGGNRLMAVLKYHVAGQDFGFSVTNYMGLTSTARNVICREIDRHHDTLLVVDNSEIDTMVTIGRLWEGIPERFAIYLKSGVVIEGFQSFPHMCGGVAMMFFLDPSLQLSRFLPDQTRPYDLRRRNTGPNAGQTQESVGSAQIRFGYLVEEWKAGRDIVITQVPLDYLDRLRAWKDSGGFLHDMSVGISLVNYK